ncbi:MAG TPA: TolC family protein [Thioploca sp.]|nr:TolC family protein [Thioploca sp.]
MLKKICTGLCIGLLIMPITVIGSDYADIARLIHEILADNPTLQAAQMEITAKQQQVKGASYPIYNPELELEAERTDIYATTIGLSQTIDWHDKQDIRQQLAQLEVQASQAQYNVQEYELSAQLFLSMIQAWTANNLITLAEQRLTILQQNVELAERRLIVGDITQVDLGLTRLSLTEAMMQYSNRQTALIQAQGEFRQVSGREIPLDFTLPAKQPQLAKKINNINLTNHHPKMLEAKIIAQIARFRIRLEERERLTDPTVGVTLGQEDSELLARLTLSIPLQMRNNYRSNVAVASQEALSAAQKAQALQRQLLAQLNQAHRHYTLVKQTWQNWQVKGSQQLSERFDLLKRLWNSGESSTTDYLVQLQQALDMQMTIEELRGDVWQSWVELLAASGQMTTWLQAIEK